MHCSVAEALTVASRRCCYLLATLGSSCKLYVDERSRMAHLWM